HAHLSVNAKGGPAPLTVKPTGDPTGPVSVPVTASDGTATAGSDYTAVSSDITFAPFELSKTLTVPITDDAINEANETANLQLNSPTGGATLGSPSTAVLSILDNDPPPTVSFAGSSSNGSEAIGSILLTVSLSVPSG